MENLVQTVAGSSLLPWIGFFVFVFAMLGLDLLVFHRKAHKVHFKEAVAWSIVWVVLSLAFNVGIWYFLGTGKAIEFLTCYVIEKSLSIDNLFVFLAIFAYFGVRDEHQHRVLFWGIIGAFVIRGIFIASGTALLQYLDFVIVIFGAFLAYKGMAMWKSGHDSQKDYSQIWLIRWFKHWFPVTSADHGHRFFVREKRTEGQGSRLIATPLFIVLLCVEFTDLVFAVDSVPAIIGITQDPFMLVTSNVMAILGLRALYFVLAAVNGMFRFLQKGMCLVLIFVGAKMCLHWLSDFLSSHYNLHYEWMHISSGWSLAVIAALIAGSIVLSLIFPNRTGGPGNNKGP